MFWPSRPRLRAVSSVLPGVLVALHLAGEAMDLGLQFNLHWLEVRERSRVGADLGVRAVPPPRGTIGVVGEIVVRAAHAAAVRCWFAAS